MAKDTEEIQLAIVNKWKNETKKEYKELIAGAKQHGAINYLTDERIYHSAHEIIMDYLKGKISDCEIEEENYLGYFSKKYSQLSEKEWKRIISSKILSKDREYIFKLALVLKMEDSMLMKILNIVDGELVRCRDPKEIIYYFSLNNRYTYEHAIELLKLYEKAKIGVYGENVIYKKEEMKSGNSFHFTRGGSSDNEESDKKLIKKLVECLPQINEDSGRYSITNVQRFARLVQYVWIKYPTYEVITAPLRIEVSESGVWSNQAETRSVSPYGKTIKSLDISFLPKPTELYKAITQTRRHQERVNSSWYKTDKDSLVETKKIIKDIYKKPSANIYEKYKLLFGSVPADRANPKDQQFGRVRRSEILLYSYFLIKGYEIDCSKIHPEDLPQIEPSDNLPYNVQQAMKEGGIWEKFDSKMQDIQDDIIDVIDYNVSNALKLKEYIDILNRFLSLFGFSKIYPRNCIDAYFLCLLASDDPENDWPIDDVLE